MDELSLYGISTEIKILLDEICELDGEMSDEFSQKLERLEKLLSEKSESCFFYRKSQGDLLDALKQRKKDFTDAINVLENKIERFEKYLVESMARIGVARIEGPTTSIVIRKPSQIVNIYDENLLPVEYLDKKIIITPKKKEIKEAIKRGDNIQGAKLVYSDKISLNLKVRS